MISEQMSVDGLPWPLRFIGAVSTACGVIAAFMILVSVFITCQMIWVRFVLNGSCLTGLL